MKYFKISEIVSTQSQRSLTVIASALVALFLGIGSLNSPGVPLLPEISSYQITGSFEIDGVFSSTQKPFELEVDDKRVLWGSWVGDDQNTGELRSIPFPAPFAVRLFVAGYPNQEDVGLYLQQVKTGKILQLPSNQPKETWKAKYWVLPITWWGKTVELVAFDQSKKNTGWIGISDPFELNIFGLAYSIFRDLQIVILYIFYFIFIKFNDRRGSLQSIRIINLALFVILYVLRRPADALYPYVWAEDGRFNIPQALEHGWLSLLIPVQGYLIIPSKILTLLSLEVSGLFYPEISYVLTLIFTTFVMIILTSKVVRLPKKEYLPLIIALLPYNPEVFSTPLYMFWWTSLLLLIPLFYSSQEKNRKLASINIASTILGCLSSPLCILLIPAMIIKTYVTKSKLDYVVLTVWSTLSVVQFSFSFRGSSEKINLSNWYLVVPKFIETYIKYDNNNLSSSPSLISHILALVFILGGFFALYFMLKLNKKELLPTSIMFVATLSAMLASWLRINMETHPFLAGPRYYFFPYIFISIFLITIYAMPTNSLSRAKHNFLKVLCLYAIIISCTGAWIQNPLLFYRVHQPLDWRGELYSCIIASDKYKLKIHTNGEIAHAWRQDYSHEECSKIANSGLFARWFGLNEKALKEFINDV